MHVITLEDGGVDSLHYGLFESDDEPMAVAQQRATELLLSRIPPPPLRILDAGIGLGTTLARLTQMGYDAIGITPDETQIAYIGNSVRAECAAFETYDGEFDLILFQESSQYIDSAVLFANAARLAPRVLVMDEFSSEPNERLHHPLQEFLDAASANGFRVAEEIDLSAKAAPTISWFTTRVPRYRDALIADLGLTGQQVDDLIAGGASYADTYRRGAFRYLLFDLRR
jgi:SAM-dependent methyltransferase